MKYKKDKENLSGLMEDILFSNNLNIIIDDIKYRLLLFTDPIYRQFIFFVINDKDHLALETEFGYNEIIYRSAKNLKIFIQSRIKFYVINHKNKFHSYYENVIPISLQDLCENSVKDAYGNRAECKTCFDSTSNTIILTVANENKSSFDILINQNELLKFDLLEEMKNFITKKLILIKEGNNENRN